MKLSGFRLFQKGDYPAAPPWFLKFIDLINKPLEELMNMAQGRTSFDNLSVETREIEVKNDTPVEIRLQKLTTRPTEAAVIWCNLFDYPDLAWEIKEDTLIRLKVRFASAPTAAIRVRLKFQN